MNEYYRDNIFSFSTVEFGHVFYRILKALERDPELAVPLEINLLSIPASHITPNTQRFKTTAVICSLSWFLWAGIWEQRGWTSLA